MYVLAHACAPICMQRKLPLFFKLNISNVVNNLTSRHRFTYRVIFKIVKKYINQSMILSLCLSPCVLLRDYLFQSSNTQIFPNLENRQNFKKKEKEKKNSKKQPDRGRNLFGNDQPTICRTTS